MKSTLFTLGLGLVACSSSETALVGDAPLAGRPDARASAVDARPGAPDARLGGAPDARSAGAPDARRPTADAPPSTGTPGIGAHTLKFFKFRASSPTTLTTLPIDVQQSGSTLIVGVGRGDITQFASPLSDNKGNAGYQSLDGAHAYRLFPNSGTATYALTGAVGGPGFTISTATPSDDEITVAALEVTHGARVADFSWALATDDPSTSATVTTDGPATLVAFWWGDASAPDPGAIAADNGFTVLESLLVFENDVQCAMAAKTVDAAGTYSVTWNATPDQGAQLWLIAVE